MKKGIVGALVGLMTLMTGCTKGVEKQYTMEIQNMPIEARLKSNENETVMVVHCKRGLSLFNYYIALPELEEDFELPKHLVAKTTDVKTKYIIINEKNKSETVSDHGYIFVKWGEN